MLSTPSLHDHIQITTERVLDVIRQSGAEALIATSPANISYLSGFHSWTHSLSKTHQTYLILTAEGKRILVLPSGDADFVSMGGSFIDEVRCFGTFFVESDPGMTVLEADELKLRALTPGMENGRSSFHEIKVALEKEGLTHVKLAIDQSYLTPGHMSGIRQELPDVDFQNAHSLLLQLRSVKSSYEIYMLRHSSRCTEKAIQDSLEIAAAGDVTDEDIRRAYEISLINSGADHLFSAIGVGTRSCFPNVVPNGSRFERGGILRYDVGCRYQGFPSDLARNATLGNADNKIQRYYRAILNGEEAAIEQMRPGVLACDVFTTAVNAVRKSGIPHYRRHHCGHAIGMDISEVPLIQPEDRTPLQPGMTFCIETPYYELGFGGLQVEDLVLVTEKGAEILTALGRDLFELV